MLRSLSRRSRYLAPTSGWRLDDAQPKVDAVASRGPAEGVDHWTGQV